MYDFIPQLQSVTQIATNSQQSLSASDVCGGSWTLIISPENEADSARGGAPLGSNVTAHIVSNMAFVYFTFIMVCLLSTLCYIFFFSFFMLEPLF